MGCSKKRWLLFLVIFIAVLLSSFMVFGVCNTEDDICDAECVLDSVCDPACYSEHVSNICNPFCIDINGDGEISNADFDAVCDPDCYNSVKNGGFYDIDCIRSNDNICDPDTHNKKDGVCDLDCNITFANGVCDLDCEGKDVDCSKRGDGICEPEFNENCAIDTDCDCDENQACRFDCVNVLQDEKGCVDTSELMRHQNPCTDSCQCLIGMYCSDNYCCLDGEYFSNGACVDRITNGICEFESPYFETCEDILDCACVSEDECCVNCPESNGQGCCPEGMSECGGKCKDLYSKDVTDDCSCNEECIGASICSENHCCPLGQEWDSFNGGCITACLDECDSAAECAHGCPLCTLPDCHSNDQCDLIIGTGENCDKDSDDCMCEAPTQCCIDAQIQEKNEYGCIQLLAGVEGDLCGCDYECDTAAELQCDTVNNHCCPEGEAWDGEECNIMDFDVLIVTVSSVQSGLGTLLQEYQDALESDGYTSTIVRIDTDDVLLCDNTLSPTGAQASYQDAQVILPLCVQRFNVNYLVIVGGDNHIRQKRVPTGSCLDPYYSDFYSDDWYADLDGDDLPDIPVGRIPAGNDNNLNTIRKYIQNTAIPLHTGVRQLPISGNKFGYVMRKSGNINNPGWGSEESWLKTNWGGTCGELGAPTCYLSPIDYGGGPNWQTNSKFMFIMQHGNQQASQYFADDAFHINIDASNAVLRDWTDSVVITIPCYGGRIHNVVSSNSIVLSALEGGTGNPASIYLGGTATQWGADHPVSQTCSYVACTACLYDSFWKKIGIGKTIGDAFNEGKANYLNLYPSGCNYCSYRIAHQTMLYGDPTIKISGAT